VIAEDIGGELKLSLSLVSTPRDTIHYAGFRVRVDSLEIRWCRGAFQSFTVSGLLRLPPTLSKPATWAQLDSLRLRLTCDASWNWLGTLDIFGGIQLDFGSYARLILHNGRIAKVAPSGPRRGYVEFTVIRLQAPPADTSSYVEFSGLRIWNNGDVELESAEGWINVSRWGNLTIAGITLQVQEVGLGYHQPSGNCRDSLKHWWVGFSGGVSIDAASGLPGGGSGVRVRRLRIYDNGCMQSEGAAINITVSGAFALRGELLWGTIRYGSGSGSGTVTASGILGQLSAAFYALGGFEAQVDFALGSVTTGTPLSLLVPAGRCRRARRCAHRARGVPPGRRHRRRWLACKAGPDRYQPHPRNRRHCATASVGPRRIAGPAAARRAHLRRSLAAALPPFGNGNGQLRLRAAPESGW
jgi:hypothetical protein